MMTKTKTVFILKGSTDHDFEIEIVLADS